MVETPITSKNFILREEIVTKSYFLLDFLFLLFISDTMMGHLRSTRWVILYVIKLSTFSGRSEEIDFIDSFQ